MYANYGQKIKERYETFDYKQYLNNNKLYKSIYDDLMEYENEHFGKLRMIHGDAVFTNIILDNTNELKFIDMRGKLGNNLTIYGDWLYDWAKMYQSLIGYDKILQDKIISIEYENHMISIFEKFFIENYGNKSFEHLKIITASLLFSLIPLHHNEKCIKYLELINTIYTIKE